jgi:hypothetical protein
MDAPAVAAFKSLSFMSPTSDSSLIHPAKTQHFVLLTVVPLALSLIMMMMIQYQKSWFSRRCSGKSNMCERDGGPLKRAHCLLRINVAHRLNLSFPVSE